MERPMESRQLTIHFSQRPVDIRRGATRDPAIDGCDTPLVKFDELARDARAPVLVDKGSLLSKKGGAPV